MAQAPDGRNEDELPRDWKSRRLPAGPAFVIRPSLALRNAPKADGVGARFLQISDYSSGPLGNYRSNTGALEGVIHMHTGILAEVICIRNSIDCRASE